MQEKDLNHDLIKLFNEKGWALKIPDPPALVATSASKRPFDGIAFFPKIREFYFESKLIKDKIKAFSFSRIEDHQFENLLKLKNLGARVAIILGIWVPRKDYYFFVFDPEFIFNLKNNKIKSFKARDLSIYKNLGLTINLRSNNKFEPDELIKKEISFLPSLGGIS